MSLAKTAQNVDLIGGVSEHHVYLPEEPMYVDDFDSIEDLINVEEEGNDDEAHGHGQVVFKIDNEEPVEKDFVFTLPLVPGGDDQTEISEDDLSDLSVDDEDEVHIEIDPWDWQSKGLGNFMNWLGERFSNIPRHAGTDTTGLERAMSYLDMLDKSISKAVRSDLKNELDVAQVEKARDEIRRGIERLQDRLEKINRNKYKGKKSKRADEEESSVVKQAQKITGVKGIMITVPLLISRIARVCINGAVSAGHDIEEIFKDQSEKYNLSKREQAELAQLLEDMGYPLRRDRGYLVDEDSDPTDGKYDWMSNYQA